MNLTKLADGALKIYDNFGGQATPVGMAVSTLAHVVLNLIERQGGPAAPAPPENIAHLFNDADGDGIADIVDPDHGTVPSVTDEMIHAGSMAVAEYDRGINFAAVYLAMYAARPKPGV